MLTLKVLLCLALTALMLAPLVLRDVMQTATTQQLQVQVPNVDAQAMWIHWPKQ